jgi:hypothetical protein
MRRSWLAEVAGAVLVTLVGPMGCTDTPTAPGPRAEASSSAPGIVQTPSPASPQWRVLTGQAAESVLALAAESGSGSGHDAIVRQLGRLRRIREADDQNRATPATHAFSLQSEEELFDTTIQAVIHETSTTVGLHKSFAEDGPSFIAPYVDYTGYMAGYTTSFSIRDRKTDKEVMANSIKDEGIGVMICGPFFTCQQPHWVLTAVIPIYNTPDCGVKMDGKSAYDAWYAMPFNFSPIRNISIPAFRFGEVHAFDMAYPTDPGIPCPTPAPRKPPPESDGDSEDPGNLVCIDYQEGWLDVDTGLIWFDNEWRECWYVSSTSSFQSRAGFSPLDGGPSAPLFAMNGRSPIGDAKRDQTESALLFATGHLKSGARTEVHRHRSGSPSTIIAIDTTSATVEDVGAALSGLSVVAAESGPHPAKDQQLTIGSFTLSASWKKSQKSQLQQLLRDLGGAPVSTIRGIGSGRGLEVGVTPSGKYRRQ